VTTQRDMIGTGSSPLAAQAAAGIFTTGLTLSGSTYAKATLLPSDFCVFTQVAGSNYGAAMPPASTGFVTPPDCYTIVNHSGQTASVYANGSGTIANTLSIFTIPNNKTAYLTYLGGPDNWAACLSN
jgi:hypothetical protein